MKWHNKPPVNGRELVAEDVKFTFDRLLAEKGNLGRYMLDSVDHVEVVDRYTVIFVLNEPFVWLLDILANTLCMWIVASEVVEKYGDLKQMETAIGTGPFILEAYEPNVKIVFRRNPEYFRPGLPYVDGAEWLVQDDESTGLAMYRTGQFDAGPGLQWNVRQPDGALYRPYMPNQLRNRGHVNDPKLAAMVQEQRRLKDPEARKQLVFAIQRYAAEQQYYVYLSSQVVTASWHPYVKNYDPNLNSDFGSRAAALWLDR